MVCVEPRSTWSHCGSDQADDQRVVVLPSTAAEAGVPPFSTDEAVAVRLRARLVVPQVAADAFGAVPACTNRPASSMVRTASRAESGLPRDLRVDDTNDKEVMTLLAP